MFNFFSGKKILNPENFADPKFPILTVMEINTKYIKSEMSVFDQLWYALEKENVEEFGQILTDFPQCFKENDQGLGLITMACYCDMYEFVKLLLENGVDPNIPNTILYGDAIYKTEEIMEYALGYGTPEMMDLLLKHGADPNKYHCLVRACEKGWKLDSLLKAGADPNRGPLTGYTPLVTAVKMNSPEKIEALIIHGADPNIRSQYFGTPLKYAIRSRQFDVVKSLLDPPFLKPLLLSLCCIREYCPDSLLNGDYLCRDMFNLIASVILESRANPNLRYKPQFGVSDDVDEDEEEGDPPLIIAADYGAEEIFDLLLKYGADPTYRTKDGRSPQEILNMQLNFHLSVRLRYKSVGK